MVAERLYEIDLVSLRKSLPSIPLEFSFRIVRCRIHEMVEEFLDHLLRIQRLRIWTCMNKLYKLVVTILEQLRELKLILGEKVADNSANRFPI